MSRDKDSGGSVYGFSAELLDGRTVSLEDFHGQVLLVVNTASLCVFTAQYAGLEQIYRRYGERGFSVLGFPSNQFGRQEPGSAEEIGAFCQKNYGVSFPMFARVDVNGKDAHPLFAFLRRSQPGLLGPLGVNSIRWNFAKFLIDRAGRPVARFGSGTKPEKMAARIEQLLGDSL